MKDPIEKELCLGMNITDFDFPMLVYLDTPNQI